MPHSVTIGVVVAVLAVGAGAILLSHPGASDRAASRAAAARQSLERERSLVFSSLATQGRLSPRDAMRLRNLISVAPPCRAHGVSGRASLACVGLGAP